MRKHPTLLVLFTVLVTALLVAVPLRASEFCDDIEYVANDAIDSRQNHWTEQEHRDYVRDTYMPGLEPGSPADIIIEDAFTVPIYSNPEDRRWAISDFTQHWRDFCEEYEASQSDSQPQAY